MWRSIDRRQKERKRQAVSRSSEPRKSVPARGLRRGQSRRYERCVSQTANTRIKRLQYARQRNWRDTGGLGKSNRHEWRCEVDRAEVQFPLPPAWVCRRRQTADGAKLGRPNRGTSTDDNRRTWRKKIKVQQLALPRCHGGATRAPE